MPNTWESLEDNCLAPVTDCEWDARQACITLMLARSAHFRGYGNV
jgi:hypothetical protein